MNKYIKLFENFHQLNIARIVDSYLECALWTEEDNLEEDDDNDYKEIYGDNEDSELKKIVPDVDINIHNFSDDSKITAYLDIKKFLELAGDAVNDISESDLGHDIWLSRNGHGAGFFDRGYDNDIEKRLMDAAEALGEIHIFISDDKILRFTNED